MRGWAFPGYRWKRLFVEIASATGLAALFVGTLLAREPDDALKTV